MARYTGPKHKLARREGVNILDKTSASLIRRLNIRPGVHGKKIRRRLSEFGQQLREKQKLKAVYGLLEKNLVRVIKTIQKSKKAGKKGEMQEMLVSSLEVRLDNIVFRLGFAKTRAMARQLVTHGHIVVNDKKVNIPSYQVKIDDVVTLLVKMQNNPVVVELFKEKENILPFLKRMGTSGKLLRLPTREDLEVPFNTQLIVEYYSR